MWRKGTISLLSPRSGRVLPAGGSAIAVTAGNEMAAVPLEFSFIWPSFTAIIMSRSTWRGKSPVTGKCVGTPEALVFLSANL